MILFKIEIIEKMFFSKSCLRHFSTKKYWWLYVIEILLPLLFGGYNFSVTIRRKTELVVPNFITALGRIIKPNVFASFLTNKYKAAKCSK